jgi:methylated-DNA-protein-cysteine methyltransferase-like protein
VSPVRVADVEWAVVAVLRALGPGEVVSYGDVAADAGHPRQSRLVGNLLAARSADLDLPWWRVVNSVGRLVPGSEVEQAARLRSEGVLVEGGRVRRAPAGRFSRPGGRP